MVDQECERQNGVGHTITLSERNLITRALFDALEPQEQEEYGKKA